MKNKDWLIIAILILAVSARIVGIWHDYPYSYYPDEEHFVNRSVSFGSGDFNPHWFHKPAFLMYLLFFEYGLYFVFGKIFGIFSSVENFAVSFFQNKGPFLLMGRLTVAFFGVAAVFVAYLVGRSHFNRRTGLLAGLFLALVVGHVKSSQVVKADVPCAFFTILSFYFIAKIYTSGRFKYYVFSGVFAGLGVATKYYSAILIPTIVLAHILYLRKMKLSVLRNFVNKASATAVMSFFLAFFVASPYNFLDPLGFKGTFVRQFRRFIVPTEELRSIGISVPEKYVLLKSLGNYFSVLISPNAMGAIGIIALAGLILLFIRLSPRNIILISFPVMFILIANIKVPFYSAPRHLNVIYPFMALFAAYFINFSYEWLQRIVSTRWRGKISSSVLVGWGLTLLVLFFILIPAVYRIVKYDYRLIQPHTKTVAKRWVEANIPAGTKIVMNEEATKLSPDKRYYEELLSRARNSEKGQFTSHADKLYSYCLKALPDITYDITYIRFPWWQEREKEPGVYFANSDRDKDLGNPLKPVGVMPYDFYKANGYEYAIVSSDGYGAFLRENSKRAKNFPSFHRFYKTLFERGALVKEFQGERGPTIRIYKLND